MNNENMNLIWGVEAIGEVIGLTARQTHHYASTGKIPVKKINGRWCAERNQLTKWFMDQLSVEAS